MKRIDTINARENMFGIGKSGFHDNADLPGQDATYVSPEWFNAVQEELCNLLELRGITLDPASKRQLYDLLTTQADLEALADEIETNFIRKNQIADDLTTNDATKVASAKQVKILQDNKLDLNANAVSATKLAEARTINGVSFNGTANINIPGVGTRSPVNMTATRLLNTVYTNTDIIPRVVSIFGGRSASARNTIIVDGEIFSEIQAANNYYDSSTMLAIVPPGKEYQVTGSPISRWVEQ